MLTNFETITEDLTELETKVVLPAIAKRLFLRQGSEQAITGREICEKMNEKNIFIHHKYKLTAVKLRKVISAMRLLSSPPLICSTSNGYFVAKTEEEIDSCIESLEQRIRHQQRTLDALKLQKDIHFIKP